MMDARLRRLIDPPLDRIGAGLADRGVGADAVTVAGFGLGIAAWAALTAQAYGTALALVLLNRLCDGLDGAVARHVGATDRGGYLDIVLDFIFYAGMPFFFAVGRPEAALPAAFLAFSFMGTASSFLAFAVFAAKRGITTAARGRKSLYYLGGLTEGAETIALFVLICLAPSWFGPAAWMFGGLCWATAASRIATGVTTFVDGMER
jgi:phosphatidylglycerophosphate synthase